MFLRNKKLDVILPDTKMEFLIARGNAEQKYGYVMRNTNLHEAVLENDYEKVKTLLADKNELKNLNEASLMNTPLTLALKQGNTRIAKYILAKAKESELELDINHKDSRGLTALDWACMLRDDEVIKMILSMPDLILPQNSYAKALYYQPVDEKVFTQFILKTHPMEIAENHGFAHLWIFRQEPYSDMVYFMRDICVNRGMMKAADFPPVSGASHVWFYRCFTLGYQTFCTERNKIPVNNELLFAMLSQESLEEWRDKASASIKFSNN